MKKTLALFVTVMIVFSSLGMVSFAAAANENVYNGHYATKMVVDSSYNAVGEYFKVTANTDYVVSWYSKGSGSKVIQVQASDPSKYNWGTTIEKATSKNGDTWQANSIEFNSGSYTFVVLVAVCNSYASKGTGYIDDLTVTKKSDGSVVKISDFENGKPYGGKVSSHFDVEYSEAAMTDGKAPDDAKTVTSIAVSNQKTEYTVGDTFVEPTVTVTYSDDTNEVVTSAIISGYDMDTAGTQTVTVSYGGKSTTYTITVKGGQTQEPDPGTDETLDEDMEDNPNVYEGHYSAKIQCESSDGFSFLTSKAIRVEPNTDYIFSVWSKGGGSPSARILDATEWEEIKTLNISGGNIWTQSTSTFNSGSYNAVLFSLTNNPYGSVGSRYVDNAFLAKASEPDVNLLQSPGFEDPSLWSFKNPHDIFYTAHSVKEKNPDDIVYEYEENIIDQPKGSSSNMLYVGYRSVVYTAGSDEPQKVYQTIEVEENTEYKISTQVRSPDGLKINIAAVDAEGNVLVSEDVTGASAWTRSELAFTSKSAGNVEIQFNSIPGQSGELSFDYCMVVPKMKIVGTGMKVLNSDRSFEENGWSGVTNTYGDGKPGFSYYIKNTGNRGDVSGGVRIMCTGDSITAGVGSSEMIGGYKKALYDKYIEYGANVSFVGPSSLGESSGFPKGSGHAGYSGWRTDQTLSSIEGWVIQYKPQVILYMLGANDSLQHSAENPWAIQAPDNIRQTMQIIHEIDPSIKVFLAKATPLGNSGKNAHIKDINAQIEQIAAENSDFITLVDQYTGFNASSELGNDYVHPNDAGYVKITNVWFEATKDVVKNMEPATIEIDDSIVYDGTHALRYNPYYVPYYTVASFELYSPMGLIDVEPNTDYTLSMMVKGDQGVSLQTRVQKTFSGGNIKTLTSTCGPMWTESKMTFNTGSNTQVVIAFVNGCYSVGNMYIDCVKLVNNSTGENVISNSSFETLKDGKPEGWGSPKSPWFFVEDSSVSADTSISITQNGQPVTSLSEGTVDVSADLTGIVDDGAVMIVALYEGNVLKNIAACEKAVNLNTSINVDSVTENTHLKVILLNNGDDIEPILTKAVTR